MSQGQPEPQPIEPRVVISRRCFLLPRRRHDQRLVFFSNAAVCHTDRGEYSAVSMLLNA